MNQHSSIRSFIIDYGRNTFLGKDSNTNYENLSNRKTGWNVETTSENYAQKFSKESVV